MIALPNISYVFGSIPSLFFVLLRALLLSGSSHDARRVFTKIRGNPKIHRRCIMSTYAIIKTGGKQVKVEVGQAIYVEKLNVEAGQEVTFNEVVLVGGENTVVGTPLVSGATVVGTVEKQGKQKKVVTYKYKPKKGSHRKQGHRQPYTKVVINAINA